MKCQSDICLIQQGRLKGSIAFLNLLKLFLAFFIPNEDYESLEEIHVLVLAHILRRPIIVVADTVLKVGQVKENSNHIVITLYLPLGCIW